MNRIVYIVRRLKAGMIYVVESPSKFSYKLVMTRNNLTTFLISGSYDACLMLGIHLAESTVDEGQVPANSN